MQQIPQFPPDAWVIHLLLCTPFPLLLPLPKAPTQSHVSWPPQLPGNWHATGQDPEDRGPRNLLLPPWSLGSSALFLEASSLLPGSLENWGLLTATAIPWVPPHSPCLLPTLQSLRRHHPGWNLFLLGPHLLWLTSPRLNLFKKQCII